MRKIKTKLEKQKALKILVDAYFEAENVTWLLRTKSKKKLYYLFQLLFQKAKAKNGAYISDNEVCVLFLYNQNKEIFSFPQVLRKIHIFLFVTGIRKGISAFKFQKSVSSIRPKEGLLGMVLAVEENKMSTALIFEMKRSVFELAKTSNQVIYAETTVPRLLRLYLLLGFNVYHEMPHAFANLTVWFVKLETRN